MKKQGKLLILGIYVLGMLWLLFGQRMQTGSVRGIQLRPFYTLRLFWNALFYGQDGGARQHALLNLVGNLVLFIPLGFLLPWIWRWWQAFWKHILLMAGLIMAVELLQWITGLGWCDVDDLLLNLVGTSLGYCLWRLFAGRTKIYNRI